jgi:hypothetical protein
MSRSKLGLVGLCLVVVGLMGATSAQASPEWLILNSKGEVKTAKELPAELVGEIDGASVSLDTHLVKLHVKITCTSFVLVRTKLESGGKLTLGGKGEFKGCQTFNASTGTLLPECSVKTASREWDTLESLEFKGQLQTNGEVRIDPGAGIKFLELNFDSGCALPSPTAVNGVLVVKDCEGKAAKHLVKHLIVQGTGTSFFVGADTTEHLETSLVGSFWMFLVETHAGLPWGAVFP